MVLTKVNLFYGIGKEDKNVLIVATLARFIMQSLWADISPGSMLDGVNSKQFKVLM